jgi:AcrR family transcriptional regulator/DNA-binding MarR family transcriptional regulator
VRARAATGSRARAGTDGARRRSEAPARPVVDGARQRAEGSTRDVSGTRRRAGAASRAAVAADGQLVEIQRSRLLAGAAGAIDELGYARTTVAQITSRARVSRRTFYELFENRDECLVALVDEVLAMVEGELDQAVAGGLPWRERVRVGLWVILSFFDREPGLARVCVVHSQQGGPVVLARREEVLGRLAGVIDGGREESSRAADCTALTAEGLVGAGMGIVYARLARGERGALTDLLSELMGMIVLPYLGVAAARRELSRPAPTPAVTTRHGSVVLLPARRDPLQEVQIRLTYRTVQVLESIAEEAGISNRVVADRAGVSDQGQISKLLARLERLGLVENSGEGHSKGEPNAWALTPLGRDVAQRLGTSAVRGRAAA